MKRIKLNKRRDKNLINEIEEIKKQETGISNLLGQLAWKQGVIEELKADWWKKIKEKFPEIKTNTYCYNSETHEFSLIEEEKEVKK